MTPLPVVPTYSRGLGGICGYTVCVLWQGVTSSFHWSVQKELSANVIEAVGLI